MGLFFVILNEPGGEPGTVNSAGLERWLRAVARDRQRGGDESADARAWLWHDSGKLAPLTLRGVTGRAFDEDNRGSRTWIASTPDGTVYASVAVDVDGHA